LTDQRGYFGIGIVHGKTESNVGTLWRSAFQLGASFIYTVGRRYPRQASDTVAADRHIPLHEHTTFDELDIPHGCQIVAIEQGGRDLRTFVHPERAIYVLGAEDHGIQKDILARAHHVVSLPSVRENSYNVAMAGTIVMYDRFCKSTDRSMSVSKRRKVLAT
jgi:tRNA G18 (ribose-2'-O)-methylase SpoU